MEAKVIKMTSPVLAAYGITIGMIGKVISNDFSEKYDYRVEFDNHRIFYFYKEEVEIINNK